MLSIIIPVIRIKNIDTLLMSVQNAISIEHEIIWEEDTERIGTPLMVKRLTAKASGEWICFLGDDTIPDVHCLDIALEYAKANDLWLVGLNDQHSQKATHWIANRELLNHLDNNEFFYTQYFHNFCDDELRHRAQRLGKYGWCEAAKLTHNHPAFGTASMDEDYERVQNPSRWNYDKALFQSRCGILSVAMIVKNEEVLLPSCLATVQGADEIIIVDTGSIDTTREIASAFTDKVYDFQWCDDFAKARNFALSKCTGDWVLSIDADELLDPDGIARIKELLSTEKNSIGINMKSGNNSYHVPRLFKNIPSTKWKGKIHEVISELDSLKCDIGITYGSSPAHEYDTNRNMRILEKVSVEDPKNTRNLYYLAREYAYKSEWHLAIDIFKKYFPLATWLPERADAYFMTALCYWNLGLGDDARTNCLNAININANFKVALLLMADMSWDHNAVQWRRMAQTATNEGTLFARLNHLTI